MKGDNKMLYGVISGMFVMIVGLMGFIWNDLTSDIDEVKVSTQAIQREYYRIALLEQKVKTLNETVNRLEDKIDGIDARTR